MQQRKYAGAEKGTDFAFPAAINVIDETSDHPPKPVHRRVSPYLTEKRGNQPQNYPGGYDVRVNAISILA